jgi:hypothetical protein
MRWGNAEPSGHTNETRTGSALAVNFALNTGALLHVP